jgi:hypothetical protein
MSPAAQPSGRLWYWILAGLVLVALIVWGWLAHRQANQVAAPNPLVLKDPLMTPNHAKRIVWGKLQAVSPRTIALPRQQLAASDWWLPLSQTSSVGYVLHDGQARWLIDGQALSFASMPTNPVGALVASSNGHALAWPTAQGVEAITWPARRPTFDPHALDPYFESDGRLAYIVKTAPHAYTVVSGTHRYALPAVGTLFAHPFLSGSVAYDQQGHLGTVNWATDRVQSIATINPKAWSTPLYAGTLPNHGLYFLLSEATPLPSYLLIVDQGGSVGYFAWQSPTTPEIGTLNGVLAMTYVRSGGQLVVLKRGRLVPLNVTPNLFSLGPEGIVWQAANGAFKRLATLP